MGDEGLIHHVDEETALRSDQRAFVCWAFSEDPSKIPHMVFLSLLKHEAGFGGRAQVHLVKPRES
jgi:hypothetical protein